MNFSSLLKFKYIDKYHLYTNQYIINGYIDFYESTGKTLNSLFIVMCELPPYMGNEDFLIESYNLSIESINYHIVFNNENMPTFENHQAKEILEFFISHYEKIINLKSFL